MTAVTLPNVGIRAGFTLGENGWNDEMNANLRTLDALVQLRVIDKDLTAPPGSPASGDTYIVGAGATGAWAGRSGQIAIWQVGDDLPSAWLFLTAREGWRAWLTDEDLYYRFTTAWVVDTPSYSQTFGDGAATSFAITHNLGTRDVHVSVYQAGSPYGQVAHTVARTSTSQVTLAGFSGTPALNELRVVVSK